MAVTHLAPGKIKAIVYFKNLQGQVKLLPSDEESFRFKRMMIKMGFIMMFAETLAEARKLQKELQDQLHTEQQVELERDEAVTSIRREQIRQRMTMRLTQPGITNYEKDFIRMWLVVREQKHDLFKKRFTQQIGNLDALEFDNPTEHVHSLLDRT